MSGSKHVRLLEGREGGGGESCVKRMLRLFLKAGSDINTIGHIPLPVHGLRSCSHVHLCILETHRNKTQKNLIRIIER